MSRKGRCSNQTSNCELARNGTLLPFAGLGSICPECGSPLALIAADQHNNTQTNGSIFETNSFEADRFEEPAQKPKTGLLNGALIVLFFLGVGVLAYVGARAFIENRNNNEAIPIEANSSFNAAQVSPIEPAIIARANSNLDVKIEPNQTSQSLGSLGIGAVVDVTGRINVANVVWARINVPNNPTKIGFVPEDMLISLSGAPISNLGSDGTLLGNNVAPSANVPPQPVLGEIVEIPKKLVYVQTNRANIRAEAGAEAVRINEALRGDTFTIDASRTNNGKTWYRVTLSDGSPGWISASLVGNSKPAPIPEVVEPEIETPTVFNVTPKSIAEGSRVVITVANVTVHSAASPEDDTKIASAERGNVLQITEITQSGGQTWYKVKSNRFGIDGWIPASAAKPAE